MSSDALTTDSRSVPELISQLVEAAGGNADSFERRLVEQMIDTSLKLLREGHDTGQLKLINAALKEMRYAYLVFNKYIGSRKVAIFGSARTPEQDPDYAAARDFGRCMAEAGWMAITGAGDGIMKAGHEGPTRDASFGLSIRLPFETTANEVIEGDPKLINFRYFFTRKLMFVGHSDAVAVLPGGFGTQDELFETLTLIQTGKSNIVPVVLLEHTGGCYWDHWRTYVRKNLLDGAMISEEDESLYYITTNPQDAADHIQQFYRVYHSSRYVGQHLVIRLQHRLTDEQIASLNTRFGPTLVRSGRIEHAEPLPGESDHLDLPRLAFDHHRHRYGELRRMIDQINDFAADTTA